MLIRDAELDGRRVSVRIAGGCIAAIDTDLPARDDPVVEAGGGALLPGLQDHHLHLYALAARRESVSCGPPDVRDAEGLSQVLVAASKRSAGWLRGVGYHESVAGDIDRGWLDEQLGDRPVRIQHRGGRLWILNSAALDQLAPTAADPLERIDGRLTGRIYDADAWLRDRLGSQRPALGSISRQLARHGITGVTDTTPQNDLDALQAFAAAQASGALLQNLRMMGGAALDTAEHANSDRLRAAAHKVHLLESRLPGFEACCAAVRRSHAVDRGVAFHCVTRTELVFALGVLREAGSRPGDRIEHASITPLELIPLFHDLGLTVVTQPGLVLSRGDRYLADVDSDDQRDLYRLRSFVDADIALAGSSDAPFGEPDPWTAMQAAVERRTLEGRTLGAGEAVSPEQALALYTSPLDDPGMAAPPIARGAVADLCLLDRGWATARTDLSAVRVRLTLRGGEPIYEARNLRAAP